VDVWRRRRRIGDQGKGDAMGVGGVSGHEGKSGPRARETRWVWASMKL
jgi:hypothetical protein